MHLLIDIGNTSAKLAVTNSGEIVHFERLSESWGNAFTRLTKAYSIDSIRLSSVAGEDAELDTALNSLSVPVLRLTYETPCCISNVPIGLGADRLAADIGAYQQSQGRTTLVIDAGTCITYDIISRDGGIIGGAISPGVQLRLKAMHEHTALLPLFEAEATAPVVGTDTKSAMLSAAVNGPKFEIEGYIRFLQKQYPDLCVYITGGNSFDFSDDITCSIVHDTYLVLKGLDFIQF